MENSPLGKLPPELRNEVYKLVLACPFQITLSIAHVPRPKYLLPEKSYSGTSLVKTCKQIYQEAAAMVYAINIFKFHHMDDLNFFVKLIGHRNASVLRIVRVAKFAHVTVASKLQEPLKRNKAARKRVRIARDLVNKYNWELFDVLTHFKGPEEYLAVALDLAHSDKQRQVYGLNGGAKEFDEYYAIAASFPAKKMFFTKIRDELDAWNDILSSSAGQAHR